MVLGRIRKSAAYVRAERWTKRHERLWIPLMLLVGLGVDVAQYKALNVQQQFVVSGAYVAVGAFFLLVKAYPRAAETRGLRTLSLAAPFAFQFSVGALLSASLVFYWFAGSFSASWPVILLVAGLMTLSEYLRDLFQRPAVQIGAFAFALFSLASIWSAYAFNSLNPQAFVLAGLSSTALSLTLAAVVARVSGSLRALPGMAVAVASVFILMLGAYFANVIPPIPLAIREGRIVHDVSRAGGEYATEEEPETWLARLLPGQTVRAEAGEPLYAFTSVFAPTDLSTVIVHKWQRFDVASREWVTASSLSYVMSGGRQDGFRGYTRTANLAEGTWRVSVETERGQILGRIPFTLLIND